MERNEIFYDWLRAKFFDTGDNDDRVKQLSAAVTDLVAVLKDSPAEVRCYTLAALDADIPTDNPRIVATYELLKKHWGSVEGKYPEAPRGILRGIMLSALYQLGTESDKLCRIIYYTASGYAQFVHFGSEQSIIDRILQEFGGDVENEAAREWALASVPTVPALETFKLKEFKLGNAEVDTASLETALKEAIGGDENGYYSYVQNSNANSQWGTHYASTASAGIAEAIQETVQNLGESLSTESLEAEINKFFNSVRASLTKTFKESFQSLLAVEQRSKLLWWKETLYSTTLRKGYREIDAAVLPVVMAIDLAKLLPEVTPVSVDYLLTDTYRAIQSAAPASQTLPELLDPFENDAHQQLLAPHLATMTDCGTRTTLTAFLAQVIQGQKTLKKLTAATGLRAEVQASPEQLAVLVLHDLLTERLIQKADAA
ncbi:GTPase-associated system all-helical protein GASH [Hymenobacter sp. ASUV-10]|uniref:GTPase-associated system all-helical protein GASH n=1 Tax=Hymenobacter aranciens TaxID=3063996 RepID=A0ABT9BL60_9BACT|nr:GTPase-associated system all-helical protein GASH [Hymenobacter sp. ASUV-10]MDO7877737.1 GTPase-associated system all-helical protein GASH [Hymenobacter sp. ASUV-10]